MSTADLTPRVGPPLRSQSPVPVQRSNLYPPAPSSDGVPGQVLAIDSVDPLITEWVDQAGGEGGGVSDHGVLTGLADDDHAQYALANGSRGAFATTAQGALAVTALQPDDVGTAAAADVVDFATAAQGALADTALQSADVGTAAAADATDFAAAADTVVKCIWIPETGWRTASGGAVPTDTTKIRDYDSAPYPDVEVDTPSWYNVYDKWDGQG